MTIKSREMPQAFKRAIVFSGFLHLVLFILIVSNPSLPKSKTEGTIYYVNLINMPGGGGGGGTSVVTEPQPLPPPKKESLRDLAVAPKSEPEQKSTMRYPVDKPKRDTKPQEKKAAITKPQPSETPAKKTESKATPSDQGGQGTGYGLRFGTGGGGEGGTGGGFGTGGGDPFGISGFPYSYYLQFISDKVTSNWFQSLVDPGVAGTFQTQVYFKIFRNGQISDLKIEVSSGIEAFDLSALRAIRGASPFPPLPTEYNGQYLGIHLIFEHSK